ncbi:hypothetical protein [Sedimentitalea nanhaiensis]|uniref:Uncharacterized protein n=1 Tax=Sedimentitalea nanhaiensis TaxID=999627 RepID=A0A1I6ZAR1_9RHOB|nr:hypothetical protein [Sedimentitalea nanhaiensis]SFT59774.1 hypothetical protein SAMN05216236_1044 [Sedimentitalea nanhaiensis]
MMIDELKKTAENLEQEIACAKAEKRLALQPQLSQVLDKIAACGERVPARLRTLDANLTDEVIEARFDNMPV